MSSRPRRLLATSTVVLLALACAGCAVNAGSAGTDRLEARFADVPDIEAVFTSASNNLPFMGSSDAHIEVSDAASSDRAAEIGHELGAFLAVDSRMVTWGASIEYHGLSVAITEDRAVNTARLDAAESLWAADVEGELSYGFVVLTAVDADALESVTARAQSIAVEPGMEIAESAHVGAYVESAVADRTSPVTSTEWSFPSSFSAMSAPGTDLAAEFDAFDQARATVDLAEATLEAGSVHLVITGDDLEVASALTELLSLGTDLEVEVVTEGA